jgi:hypothetical protein
MDNLDNVLQSLADALRKRLPGSDMQLPKDMRRLIVGLEYVEAGTISGVDRVGK